MIEIEFLAPNEVVKSELIFHPQLARHRLNRIDISAICGIPAAQTAFTGKRLGESHPKGVPVFWGESMRLSSRWEQLLSNITGDGVTIEPYSELWRNLKV